jgi:tape measure domain-containing protein
MSTVDERVVEMRFDNKHFESNVQTSLSTLDKLKEKLNFSGASKGLEEINAASRKVDMSGLGSAVETVHTKFSALEVMGVTALANITNSAVNAGKRMISALTIDPVKTGLQEYETQINAIQTILSNTQHEGTTLEDVNTALDELNKYADMTIYNFTEMTRNIGTFTAAGVGLDTSVSAIKGIANLAAVSGSTSQQASTAMYQLSQAIANGKVQLMDWNSVVNAGMGGKVFQDALVKTGAAMAGMTEEAFRQANIGAKSFRESLNTKDGTGWLTSDVLLKTLEQFTMAAEEGTEQWEKYKKSLMEEGYTETQAEEILKMANNATDAATKVKTFTQLWDTLKEAAQSGWTQSWEIIIGDFKTAKESLSTLYDTFSAIINASSDARNFILKGALMFSDPWGQIMEKLDAAGLTKIKDVAKDISDAADKVKYFQEVVSKVWHGDYNNRGDNPDRFDLLTQAGYDARVVQDLVNLGLDYKITIDDVKASHEKFGLTLDVASESVDGVDESIRKLTDDELKNAGLTKDEIDLYRALEEEADRLGITVEKLADNMSKTDGRSLMIESLKNIWDALTGLVNAAKTAWTEIFDPPTSGEIIIKLYSVLDAINKFTEKLRFTTKVVDDETGKVTYKLNDTGEKFIRIFKGMFAVIEVVTTILGGGFKIAFEFITKLLGYFNVDILEVLANVGDAAVKFNEWFHSLLNIDGVVEKVGPAIEIAIEKTKEWVAGVKDSETFQKFIDILIKGKDAIIGWFTGIKDSGGMQSFLDFIIESKNAMVEWFGSLKDKTPEEIAQDIVNGVATAISTIGSLFGNLKDIVLGKVDEIPDGVISGFANGLWEGAKKIGQVMLELGQIIIDKIKEKLVIHSPSAVFFAIGGFIIAGLVGGLLSSGTGVADTLKSIVDKAIEVIKSVDIGAVFVAALSTGALVGLFKLTKVLESFSSPFEALGSFLENTGEGLNNVLTGLGKSFKANAFKKNAQSILMIAGALLVLVGALYLLSMIQQQGNLWECVGALTAVAAILAVLAIVINKFGSTGDLKSNAAMTLAMSTIVQLGIAMLLLTVVAKIIAGMTWDELGKAGVGIGGLYLIITGLIKATKSAGNDIGKVGGTILKVGIAMLLLVAVGKIIAGMSWEDMAKAGVGLIGLEVIIAGLIKATKSAGNDIGKVGGTILKVGIAMLLLVAVGKIIAGMTWEDMAKAGVGLIGLEVIIAGLIKATKSAGTDIDNVGGTILKVGIAMLLLIVVAKIIAGMTWEDLAKAGAGLVGLELIVVGLIKATKAAGTDIDKVGSTLIKTAIAIGILAAVAALLGFLSVEHLAKGIIAVGILSLIVDGLMIASKNTTSNMGSIIAIAVAIGVLAASVGILTLVDTNKLYGAAVALSVVMGVLVLVLKATEGVKKDSLGPLIVLSVAIALLSAALYLLSDLDSNSVLKSSVALSLVIGLFALLVKASENASASIGTLVVLTVAIGVIAAALYLLSTLPIENTLGAAVSLSVLLVALAASARLLNTNIKIQPSAIVAMGIMLVIMGILGAVLYLLKDLDITSSISTIAGVSILLIALVACVAILSGIKTVSATAIVAVGVLALVIAEFAVILYLLKDLPVESTLVTTVALSLLMGAMTVVLLALSAVSPTAVLGAAALALLGLVMVELAAVLLLMSMFDVNPSIEVAAALSLMLISMSAALVLLSAVGLMGPAALIGISSLGALIVGIGGLIVGIGALVEKFPMLETFLNTGIPIVEQIGYAIGSFFGNIVGGFLGNLTSGLPDMATDLSNFMTNLQPFIEGAKNIDSNVIAGVGYLSAAIIAISVADLINGITSFLQFGSSLADLGTELSKFMVNVLPFVLGANLIKPEMLEGIRTLSEVILILSAAGVLNGLASLFGEATSLASFGEQLPDLGKNIKEFADNLGEFSDVQITSINGAAEAIKILADAANAIPGHDGLWQKIVGEQSLATFGEELTSLGTGLKDFLNALGEDFTEDKLPIVRTAAEAVKIMAEAANAIPGKDGLWQSIVGDKSLAAFGEDLKSLGENLCNFVAALGEGFTEDKLPIVRTAAEAIKIMAEAANAIPAKEGLWQSIVGDKSLAAFGSDLPVLGENLLKFVENLGTFTPEQVTTVTCAADAIKALALAANSLPDGQAEWTKKLFGDDGVAAFSNQFPLLGSNLSKFVTSLGTFTDTQVTSVSSAISAINAFSRLANADLETAKKNLPGFGDKLPDFAKDIKSFISNMPSSTDINSATANVDKIIKSINDIAGVDANIAVKFTDSLKNIGKDGVQAFIDAFTSQAAKTDAKNAAIGLMDKVGQGAEEREESVAKKFQSVARDAANAIKDKWQSFYDAGKYLVEGLASGISENSYIASAKAAAMARAAADAAEEELDINSPSKVFRAIGYSVPEGFAQGIDRMGGMVKMSVVGMTDGAVSSVGKSISKIADAINTDIDAQPTIRPVLDLSDVREGAGSINGLFDTEAKVGLLSRVGTISTAMSRTNQNGNSDDVVSAINKLNKELSGAKGDTYIIEGITYDEGSDVADAIKAITRYAKIERRM